jgi:hypothetical protein
MNAKATFSRHIIKVKKRVKLTRLVTSFFTCKMTKK